MSSAPATGQRVCRIIACISLTLLTWSTPQAQCTDCDGDGFHIPADCDDSNPAVHPGAEEVCDLIDNDCDSLIDDETVLVGPISDPQGTEGARLGTSIAWIADLDGDGVEDLVAGAPRATVVDAQSTPHPEAGLVLVLSGKTGEVLLRIENPFPAEDDHFGNAVAAVPSVNPETDQIADILIACENDDFEAYSEIGTITVISGADGQVMDRIPNPDLQTGSRFGYSLAVLDDLDGDGAPDIAVGARAADTPAAMGAGNVSILSGHAPWNRFSTIHDPAGQTGDAFGYSLTGIQDLDSDGYSDIAVGAYAANKAQVYSALDGVLLFEPIPPGLSAGDNFGISLALVPDLNSDGISEIAIGAEGYDAGRGAVHLFTSDPVDGFVHTRTLVAPFGIPDEWLGYRIASTPGPAGLGSALLFAGTDLKGTPEMNSPSKIVVFDAMSGQVLRTLHDPLGELGSSFGRTLIAGGDANGDGIEDIAVGADRSDASATQDSGALYLLTGQPGQDLDQDGFAEICDCFDDPLTGSNTYPGAAPNDDPSACMQDEDGDDFGSKTPLAGATPGSDCDDLAAGTNKNAIDIPCDGINQDCVYPPDEIHDEDEDGFDTCGSSDVVNPDGLEADCAPFDPFIYPGAPQDCDGINTDCLDPNFPQVPGEELDLDGDRIARCTSHCGHQATRYTIRDNIYAAADVRQISAFWDGTGFSVFYELGFHEAEGPVKFQRYNHFGIQTLESGYLATTCRAGSGAHARMLRTEIGYTAAWNCGTAWNVVGLDLNGAPKSQIHSFGFGEYLKGLEFALTDSGYAMMTYVLSHWEYQNVDYPYGLYLAFFNENGEPTEEPFIQLSDAGTTRSFSLARLGDHLLLAWVNDGLQLGFFNLTTRTLQIQPLADVSHSPLQPRISTNGGLARIVWSDARSGARKIYSRLLIPSSGATAFDYGTADQLVSQAVGQHISPNVAWDGQSYIFSWVDTAPGQEGVYISRTTLTGTPISAAKRIGGDYSIRDPTTLFQSMSTFPAIAPSPTRTTVWWSIEGKAYPNWPNSELYVAALDCFDCDDQDPTVYPFAPENNDGYDNQCPDDAGYGLVDEILEIDVGPCAEGLDFMCWDAQAGATSYETVFSAGNDPQFSSCWYVSETGDTHAQLPDPDSLAAGNRITFGLVAPSDPHQGSYGLGTQAIPRMPSCSSP